MKVKDVIAELSKYDADMPVMTHSLDGSGDYREIDLIELNYMTKSRYMGNRFKIVLRDRIDSDVDVVTITLEGNYYDRG